MVQGERDEEQPCKGHRSQGDGGIEELPIAQLLSKGIHRLISTPILPQKGKIPEVDWLFVYIRLCIRKTIAFEWLAVAG